MEPVRAEAEARVQALAGIDTVSAMMTAHIPQRPAAGPERPKRGEPKGRRKCRGWTGSLAIARARAVWANRPWLPIWPVRLAAEGRRVGLLDADVYGPSQPRMLGVSGRPASPDGKTILPMRNHGVTMMSIGLMTNEDQAVVWRGPMLMGALQQMMSQVQWGALDVLIVDLPPGTGDVQMTLARKTDLTARSSSARRRMWRCWMRARASTCSTR